ncbi:MAG: hypothetical protein FJ011_26105 [Chloroflexi bacterium]|nr:hypothetical protein [Chloroflexota bacterium]
MRIARITAYPLRCALKQPFAYSQKWFRYRTALLVNIPIAGGEAEFTRYGFRSLIAQAAVDILQPDLCSAGGISEGLKIAALARAWSTRVTPHVWGAGVAIAAALHFIAALPDQPPSLNPASALLELDRIENPLREELLGAPLQIADSCAHVPQGPGLGIEVNEDALAAYRFG